MSHIVESGVIGSIKWQVCYDECYHEDSPLTESGDDSVKPVFFDRRAGIHSDHGFQSPEDAIEWATENRYRVFPVFKYEHGGVAYSISPFSCPWDSGQVGFLFLSVNEWPDTDSAEKFAKAAIEEFSAWANGEIYYWSTRDSKGNTLDSCGGFIGCLDYVIDEAKENAAYHAKRAQEDSDMESAKAMADARPDLYPNGLTHWGDSSVYFFQKGVTA